MPIPLPLLRQFSLSSVWRHHNKSSGWMGYYQLKIHFKLKHCPKVHNLGIITFLEKKVQMHDGRSTAMERQTLVGKPTLKNIIHIEV